MSCHLSFISTLRKIHKPRVPHQSSFWQSQGTTLSCKINTDVPHSGNWLRGDSAYGDAQLCKDNAFLHTLQQSSVEAANAVSKS